MENKSPFILLFVCAIFGGIFVDMQVGNILAEEKEGFFSQYSIPVFTILFTIGVLIMYKTVFGSSDSDEEE